MSGPAGACRPICVFCRLVPHHPPTTTTTTTPAAARRKSQSLLKFARNASTQVYIPKRYGQNTGKTIEKVLEDRYFVKLMRSQEEPPVVVPMQPGTSKATRDFRGGRFYVLEPLEMMSDIVAHDFPEEYFWPNPRTHPGTQTDHERTWRDIDWLGWDNPIPPKDRQGNKLKLENIREAITKNVDVEGLYFSQIDVTKNNAVKHMVLLEAFRIYMKQKSWDKFRKLLELVQLDSRIRPFMERGIENQLFKELAAHGRTNKIPAELFNMLTMFQRPFTNECLLYLLDHIKSSTTVLKLFFEDHGILPHISVSNKAFAKDMSKFENSRKWPKNGNRLRTDPMYYTKKRRIYRKYTTHFDPDRVNAESIRLLLKYAIDRDEIKRIWNIALQGARRDPGILRKNQHFYLAGLLRFPIEYEKLESGDPETDLLHFVYQNAENVAESCSILHTLKQHKQQLNRDALMQLIIISSKCGSSRTLNTFLPKLRKSRWTPTAWELRKILRALPQEYSADIIAERHKIIGDPKSWVLHQQKLIILSLHDYVGNDQSCLVEYIKALGRCGATSEIWKEWSELRERGFSITTGGEKLKDGTLVAFISALGLAGDAMLLKRCFKDIRSFKTTSVSGTPMLLAGLLVCRPARCHSNLGPEYTYPLPEVFGAMLERPRILEGLIPRARKNNMNTHWDEVDWHRLESVLITANWIARYVRRGEDLIWAESALTQLLSQVSHDGSVPNGRVSVEVEWPTRSGGGRDVSF